ncbi:GrpB family protein [Pedobacter sp. Hv1]|uniref:GrpB family protein n=1 Tax=Pedobacter sp. Hv1 TaxID=1740090 RepID=UPI0006D8CAD0|nr:GrpB family protein [Pedobacter sp. Hv1]KQC00678.1 hypothetical protein AQF98_08330 [Pedobacter sp. Hv1]
MSKDKIEIAAYNPVWKDQFEELKNVYALYLKDIVKGIEHVGSTAVPGLAAKPVLDIDLVIDNETKLQKVISVLTGLGYEFRGDLGIKDRYAFRANSIATPNTGTHQAWPKHHLYCCIANSVSLNNHLTLRNALRADPTLRIEYDQLKKDLANATTDMEVYIEGKSDFIAKVLSQNGLAMSEIEDIIKQNLKKN